MRIGMITGEYPPLQGGVGAYSRILAGEIAAQGHEVFVLSRSRTTSADSAVCLTAIIDRWNVASLFTIRRWAQVNRLDVVNLQYQTAAYDMSPYIHFLPHVLRSIPVVTTFHDLRYPYLFPKAGRLRDWIVMHLARASNGAISTNHEDAARLRDLPCAAMIPIGSNILQALPADYTPEAWRERVGAQPDDFLIVYFGLINSSKGLEPLLHSLASLRAEGIPARLLIIGSAGSSDPTNATYAATIDSLIAQLKLEPHIHRTGYIDDDAVVGAYLSAADAVALPFLDGASYRRGSLMAAIRYACPTVTTTPQVEIPTFKDGDNLLLVAPNDAPALTNALRRLHESPDLRDRLRRGAAELARHFDWTHIARETIAFFARVTGVNV